MKSDTNLIKLFGIFGAICVLLSTFMNVATLKFYVGATDEAEILFYDYESEDMIEEDITVEEAGVNDEDMEDCEVYMRYGLTMWEIRTLVTNYAADLSWNSEDRTASLEALESIDKEMFNEIFGMYGIEFKNDSIQNVFDFMKYVFSSYALFLFLPFVLIVACVGMLAGTISSKHIVKVIALLAMVAGFVLMILPSKNFFGIMGVGPVVMMIGIVLAIISTIGSFVSPGVIYVEEER